MADKRTGKLNRKTFRYAALLALSCLLALAFFTGCSLRNKAEKKVAKELRALQSSDSVGSELLSLRESLSDDGKKDFDLFLTKVRGFRFEINGTKEDADPDDNYNSVRVTIKTYDFGREYLAAWTEYLKTHKDALSDDDDLTEFYETLFERLASVQKREYIKNITIICIDPLGNNEWIANIKENDDLQDAILGGMMSEMEALAAE